MLKSIRVAMGEATYREINGAVVSIILVPVCLSLSVLTYWYYYCVEGYAHRRYTNWPRVLRYAFISVISLNLVTCGLPIIFSKLFIENWDAFLRWFKGSLYFPYWVTEGLLLFIGFGILYPIAQKLISVFALGGFYRDATRRRSANNSLRLKQQNAFTRCHFFFEPSILVWLILTYGASFSIQRILLTRCHWLWFVVFLTSDLIYSVIHFVVKFSHTYQILMLRYQV